MWTRQESLHLASKSESWLLIVHTRLQQHTVWSTSLEQFFMYRGWTAADQVDQADGSQPLTATAVTEGIDSDST